MNNCTLTDLERSTGKFCRLMNCQACKDYRTKMIKKRKIKSDIYETTINEIIHAMNRLDSDLWTHTVENIDELKTDEIILIARGEKSNDIRKYIDKQMRDCGTEGK